jgi:hypothetical protein
VFVESSKQEFLNARNEAFSSFFSVLREAGEVVEVRDILRGFRPSPGDVLVVGVPLRGFLPAEAALLRTAVRDTGIALVLIAEWGGTPANVDHLNQLISGLGVAFNRDVVCQYGGAGAVTCAMALDGLRDHPIMSGVSGIQVEAACSISISDRSVSPLMWGGERSFADSNFNMFPDSFERRGFVVISAALSHGNGRVVLFGDSDMFSNRYLRLGNLQMLRNAIAWSSTAASGRPASGLNLTPDRAASLSCGMSDDEALLGYIRGCQASGFTRDEIRHRLLSEGYTEDEIRGPLGEA